MQLISLYQQYLDVLFAEFNFLSEFLLSWKWCTVSSEWHSATTSEWQKKKDPPGI
jgi:hypothetical protein